MEEEITYWEERAEATEEALRRLMMIVAQALPHTQQAISDLHAEWMRVQKEIESAHQQKAAN